MGAINHQHAQTRRRAVAVAKSTTGRAPARAEPTLAAAEPATFVAHWRSDLGGPRPSRRRYPDTSLDSGSPPRRRTTPTASSLPVPPRAVIASTREAPRHPRPVREGEEVLLLPPPPHGLRPADAEARGRKQKGLGRRRHWGSRGAQGVRRGNGNGFSQEKLSVEKK